MSVVADIVVSSPAWSSLADLDALTERAVRQCVSASNVTLAENCELCVAFSDDAEIRALNARWRGQDKPTNVLSFPTPGALAGKPLLGDIVIAHETVAREAREQGKTLRDHTAHMIVHGFLHLIGYDHETPRDAEAMETLERRIALALGFPDPYAETEPPADGERPDK
jgi:probable rRNA maturation factor